MAVTDTISRPFNVELKWCTWLVVRKQGEYRSRLPHTFNWSNGRLGSCLQIQAWMLNARQTSVSYYSRVTETLESKVKKGCDAMSD
eukprot:609365-Pyramimonas_sp.AAC.1